MHSKQTDAALRDILFQIALAQEFIQGFDASGFIADAKTVYAVTRCLEIISEASRRLPDDLKARHSAIAWKQMAEHLSAQLRRCRGALRMEDGHRVLA